MSDIDFDVYQNTYLGGRFSAQFWRCNGPPLWLARPSTPVIRYGPLILRLPSELYRLPVVQMSPLLLGLVWEARQTFENVRRFLKDIIGRRSFWTLHRRC